MGECNHEWSGFAPDCDLCGMSAADRIAELEDALKEISLGKGAFSLDPQQHANNTIENMKSIALAALEDK